MCALVGRRQLSPTQKAMVAAEARKLYEGPAKERQRAAGGDRKSGKAKSVVENLPQVIDAGKARNKAGEAVGVSIDRATVAAPAGARRTTVNG